MYTQQSPISAFSSYLLFHSWQQKRVDSIGYTPGPLSQRKEYNVDAFIRWYLKAMRG